MTGANIGSISVFRGGAKKKLMAPGCHWCDATTKTFLKFNFSDYSIMLYTKH